MELALEVGRGKLSDYTDTNAPVKVDFANEQLTFHAHGLSVTLPHFSALDRQTLIEVCRAYLAARDEDDMLAEVDGGDE